MVVYAYRVKYTWFTYLKLLGLLAIFATMFFADLYQIMYGHLLMEAMSFRIIAAGITLLIMPFVMLQTIKLMLIGIIKKNVFIITEDAIHYSSQAWRTFGRQMIIPRALITDILIDDTEETNLLTVHIYWSNHSVSLSFQDASVELKKHLNDCSAPFVLARLEHDILQKINRKNGEV